MEGDWMRVVLIFLFAFGTLLAYGGVLALLAVLAPPRFALLPAAAGDPPRLTPDRWFPEAEVTPVGAGAPGDEGDAPVTVSVLHSFSDGEVAVVDVRLHATEGKAGALASVLAERKARVVDAMTAVLTGLASKALQDEAARGELARAAAPKVNEALGEPLVARLELAPQAAPQAPSPEEPKGAPRAAVAGFSATGARSLGAEAVHLWLFPDRSAAKEGLAEVAARRSEAGSSTVSPGRYAFRGGGLRGQLRLLDRAVVGVETAEDGDPDGVFSRLPFIGDNPEANVLTTVFVDHGVRNILILVLAFLPLWFGGLLRVGSWGTEVRPAATAQAVPLEELKARILAMDQEETPIRVRDEGGGRLVLEWKYLDARWLDVLNAEAGATRSVHRIRLQLDADVPVVRAQDANGQVTYRADAGGVLEGQASWSTTLGITLFQVEAGRHFGLLWDGETGLRVDDAYRYTFDLQEMKQPLIELVTRCGWRFRPVVVFAPWLTG